MRLFDLPLLFATPGGADGAAASGGAGGLLTFAPFVLIIAIFYFLIIRPQNKKQKETQKMLESLKKGDKIVTIGGIHGTISSVKEKTVVVKVDDNVKIEFLRSAISTVDASGRSEDKEEKSDEKEDKKAE